MFERCIELFDEYYRIADTKHIDGFSAALGCEIRERLQQMNWLLSQVRLRDDELSAITTRSGLRIKAHVDQLKAAGLSYEGASIPMDWPMSQGDGARVTGLMFEIQLHVECFYYFAGRARSIIRGMPKLKSFESEGVRNVRNHLIEHPEGNASKVLSRSFAFSGAAGPVVKAVRESSETAFPDAGLFANAQEFAGNFETALMNAIQGFA